MIDICLAFWNNRIYLKSAGFQTNNLSYVDVEYMWYKNGKNQNARSIPGRYENEVGGIKEELDESLLQDYRKQIVSKID